MIIRIAARPRGFTQIDNRTLRDVSISLKAKGALSWLLSFPDDWQGSAEELIEDGPDGRDAVRAALRELERSGYLERSKERGSDGRWRTVVVVLERPRADGKPDVTEDGLSVLDVTSENVPNPQVGAMTDSPASEKASSSTKTKPTDQDQTKTLAHAPKVRERDLVWDTLVVIFGAAPKNPNLRGAWNVAAKELRDQGATPEEMGMRFARYRSDMPNAACTPMALAKHWGRYAEDTPATRPVSKFDVGRARRRMRDGQTQSRGDNRVGRASLGLGDGAGDVRSLD